MHKGSAVRTLPWHLRVISCFIIDFLSLNFSMPQLKTGDNSTVLPHGGIARINTSKTAKGSNATVTEAI